MTIKPETLGTRLRLARKRQGLSQSEVARACGLDTSQISFFETDARTPIARNIVKLSEALNITTDELLGRNKTFRITCPTCGGTGQVVSGWGKK